MQLILLVPPTTIRATAENIYTSNRSRSKAMRKVLILFWILITAAISVMAQSKVVDPAKLQQLLPKMEMPGFTRLPETSEINNSPFGRISRAEVKYVNDPQEVATTFVFSIEDLGEAMGPRNMAMAEVKQPEDSKDERGAYTKSVTIQGKYPGKEQGDAVSKAYGMKILVADRFLLHLGAQNPKTLYSFANSMNLEALEKMAKEIAPGK
jgi:hypothetical protein